MSWRNWPWKRESEVLEPYAHWDDGWIIIHEDMEAHVVTVEELYKAFKQRLKEEAQDE